MLSFLIYTKVPLSFFHNSQNYPLRNCFLIFNILLGFYREEDDGVKRENKGCVRNLWGAQSLFSIPSGVVSEVLGGVCCQGESVVLISFP